MAIPNVHSPQQEIVSQLEPGNPAMLAGEASPGAGAMDPSTGNGGSGAEAGSVQPYQFRDLARLPVDELRKLTARHEGFARTLAARLSGHLRLETSLQLSRLETQRFHKFLDGMASPTYVALLKVEPLQGVCLLQVPPKLGLGIVDRELGGPAQHSEESRALSEIEARLLSRVVDIIALEWCGCWSDLLELRAGVIGHESNSSFVQTCPRDTVMLVVNLELRLGEIIESIQLGIPYASLEPLLLKLNAGPKTEKNASARSGTGLKWNPVLNDVSIKVSAELPEMEMTPRQLAELKPGSTLFITPEMARQVRVCLAKKPKFVANLGTSNQRWAAKIVQLLKA